VLHDLGLALAADRLLVLAGGRVAVDGPPGDATVRAALVRAFGDAIRIVRLDAEGDAPARWIAVPRD
jgi:iron complex transport system ATP-binding protein